MRARLLKPGFFDDAELCKLPMGARLLFAGLWCLADREGRLLDIPRRIAVDVFPHEEVPLVDVQSWLSALAEARGPDLEHGFIVRYKINNLEVIQIVNFLKHQKPHLREAVSEIPAQGQGAPKTSLRHAFDAEAAFQLLWERHPKQRYLHLAQQAYSQLLAEAPDQEPVAASIERSHKAHCQSDDWIKDGGKFAPQLHRWLLDKGHLDGEPQPGKGGWEEEFLRKHGAGDDEK